MKKIFVLIIFVLISAFSFSQTLSEISVAFNKMLPLRRQFMTLENTSFSNNVFTWYYTFDWGQYMDFTIFSHKPVLANEHAKILTAYMYQTDSYMFNRMIEKNVCSKYHIYDKAHNVVASILLSPGDLKTMISRYGKMTKDMLTLNMQNISTKIQVPFVADATTTLINSELTNTYFEYQYEINEALLDIQSLKAPEAKQYFAGIIKDMPQPLSDTIDALIKTRKSLRLTYIGNISKERVTITFTSYELNRYRFN